MVGYMLVMEEHPFIKIKLAKNRMAGFGSGILVEIAHKTIYLMLQLVDSSFCIRTSGGQWLLSQNLYWGFGVFPENFITQ
jgi:hypothetical protein